MTRTALIFLLTLALVSVAAASEIVIENDGDQQYLTFVTSDATKIAGYNIQLNYSADTTILSVEPLEPYTGVFGIRNEEGWTRIVGFTGGDTYSARLARFTYAGEGDFSIIVYELYDSDLNDVTVSNTVGSMPEPDATGSPTPTVPEYQPDPGYVPPTGTATGATPVTGGSSTGSGAVGNPTPASTTLTQTIPSAIPSTPPAVTGESTPAPTPSASVPSAVSPEMTSQSTDPQTTPKSPLNALLVIIATIIAAFCLTTIRKHI